MRRISAPLRSTVHTGGFVEDLLTGEVVETPLGKHFETEKLYASHQRHGSYEISDLIELPPDLLTALSDGAIPLPPHALGLSRYRNHRARGRLRHLRVPDRRRQHRSEGFRVRQFFMRDYGEEPSVLHSLSAHLARFDVLITYNGRTYDQPLLETRYTMCRARHPFARMEHLDLLYGARRLFKLRLENCRLVNLENQILGVERDGRHSGRDDPLFYLRIPAHQARAPPDACLPSQRARHRVAGLPDRA